MLYVLAITILSLLGVAVYHMALMAQARREHDRKMDGLRRSMIQLGRNVDTRQKQLLIADELVQRLRSANNAISRDVAGLVKDIVEALSKHDLIE